jgi:hypothetical protein
MMMMMRIIIIRSSSLFYSWKHTGVKQRRAWTKEEIREVI